MRVRGDRIRWNDFPRYNMKWSGGNVIKRGIFHVVSPFPLHFMSYQGNLDSFSNSDGSMFIYLPTNLIS